MRTSIEQNVYALRQKLISCVTSKWRWIKRHILICKHSCDGYCTYLPGERRNANHWLQCMK